MGTGNDHDARIAATERERALAAEAARWERDWHRAHEETDRAITDIGVTILALRACDEAGEAVPTRLRAHIRVMEDEWFNLPTPEGAARREKLTDVEP